MRVRSIAALGAAAYAAFLVATLPASVVAPRIAATSRGAVALSAASGSAWNGRASAVVQTAGGALALDEVRWRFLPDRLASGRLAFALSAAASGLDASGAVERGWSEWAVRDVRARLDAGTASAALPWMAPWRPEGTVSVTAPELRWMDPDLHGVAVLEWRNAAVGLSPVHPLGAWRLEAKGEGGPMRLTVATIEGPLRVSGRGTFTPPASAAFSGEAHGEGESARALEPLLDLVGPRRADGAHALELRLR